MLQIGFGAGTLPPMLTNYYIGLRITADNIGIDPWDTNITRLIRDAHTHEQAPASRYWFGSPCRFIRTIDMIVHLILPALLIEKHPIWAAYLRTTSPRWGKAWRHW